MIKQIIKEDKVQTVNDAQLKDLYDASCKTEQQIINLSIASMSFSNPQIKKAVVALKSQASQLSQLIGGALQIDDSINSNSGDERQALDSPEPAENMIGESKNWKNNEDDEEWEEFQNFKKNKKNKNFKLNSNNFEDDDDFDMMDHNVHIADGLDTNYDDEIDMTESFDYMSEGVLSNKNFNSFKTASIKILSEVKVKNKKDLSTIIESINKSSNIKEINEEFNNLYNYADKENIKIITESKKKINEADEASKNIVVNSLKAISETLDMLKQNVIMAKDKITLLPEQDIILTKLKGLSSIIDLEITSVSESITHVTGEQTNENLYEDAGNGTPDNGIEMDMDTAINNTDKLTKFTDKGQNIIITDKQ